MMNINIKRMDCSHIKALSEIEKECFSTTWSENALSDELTNNFARFFVAKNITLCYNFKNDFLIKGDFKYGN